MAAANDLEARVFARIDELEDELVKVALDLSNVDAVNLTQKDEAGNTVRIRDIRQHERIAAEYVDAWLQGNGIETKRLGAPDRFNVLGIHRGTGNGRSVMYCSHLDVGIRDGLEWIRRDPDRPHMIGAWKEGDGLVGQGICNCKGPMACWMISTKAIKDAGVRLPGDVLLSAVIGETEGAPVDEYESPKWDSHELGARYVASHGGLADYALIAEATAFSIVPMMTGLAYFKITVYAGPSASTFFVQLPEESMETSINAVLRMAKFMERFVEYVNDYKEKSTYSFDGGTVVPRGQIGAIRAGVPAWPIMSPELCSIYCHFTIAPGKDPLDIQRDLEGILADMGTEGRVEMFKHLPGHEAWRNKGYDTFRNALTDAHSRMFNQVPGDVASQFVSMWRDINPYNEIGVPAISYGFPTGYTHPGAAGAMNSTASATVKISDMIKAAKIYASLAIDLCSRPASDPL